MNKIYTISFLFLFIISFTGSLAAQDSAKEVNVLQFKSSAETDLDMIQQAIDHAAANGIASVYIPDGEYKVDATMKKGIALTSNLKLRMSEGTVIKALPSKSANYTIVRVHNASNVEITGGKIVGERNEHLGTGGEWGMGIDIRNSENVNLNNLTITDCWGDGVYIAAGGGASKNITIDNVVCDNNRRQGVSVIQADGLIVKNSTFMNTNGTGPAAGIDLEPNNQRELVTNVLIDSCSFVGNQGLGIHLYGKYGPVRGVKITNCIVDNNPVGISVRYAGVHEVEFSNIKISNSKTQGLRAFQGARDIKYANISIDESAKNAITISEAENIELYNFSVNNYEQGVLIEKSNNVNITAINLSNNKEANDMQVTNATGVVLNNYSLSGGSWMSAK